MTTVLLATCSELPDGDEDGAALLAALARVGIEGRYQVWDDPSATWDAGLTVLRSTWDYTAHRDRFLNWTRSVPRLLNPAAVAEWNSDKLYLHELAQGGVPIVATEFIAPGSPLVVPESAEFVVKPSVGAGSRGAGRFSADARDAADQHLVALHDAGRTAMIQPYLDDVDEHGETALIYLGGRFSHAIEKSALLAESMVHDLHARHLYVEESIAARTATEAELAVGEQALAFLRGRFGADLLYVRVDLLPSAAGPVVIELEVTEPSLFLGYADGAADRLAAAIAAVTTR